MYLDYFGLRESPFSIAVNPRYLYLSERHKEALNHLLYGVSGGGFVLLTGEVGTGKTTLNRYFLAQLPDSTRVAVIQNPRLSEHEFLAAACEALGLSVPDNASLKTLFDALGTFLLDQDRQGQRTILMIDEAQHLSLEVLEQVRLLTNLETDTHKLVQIVLIGQPELLTKLNKPELRQLNQRVTGRYKLGALSLHEVQAYLDHRLGVAGLAPGVSPFGKDSVEAIYRFTGGVPRLINLLCDRVLLALYAKQLRVADKALTKLAAHELWQLDGELQVKSETTPKAATVNWLTMGVAVIALVAIAALGWVLITGYSGGTPAKDTAAEIAPSSVVPTLPIEQYERLLAVLWRSYEGAGTPCADRSLLRCQQAVNGDWQALAALNRPVILELLTPLREKQHVLLHSVLLDGTVVKAIELASSEGVVVTSLAQVAPMWTGGYSYIWQPPPGFDGPLGLGSAGEAVAQIAQKLARLDGTTRVLAEREFTPFLHARVIEFQSEQGLTTDGVVGQETLVRLNAVLNERPTLDELRGQWQRGQTRDTD